MPLARGDFAFATGSVILIDGGLSSTGCKGFGDVSTAFDFIIIGAGWLSAVAARLSERPGIRAAAGGGGKASNPLHYWPAGFAQMTKGLGWGWSTVPQRHYRERFSATLKGRSWAAGRPSMPRSIPAAPRKITMNGDRWVVKGGAMTTCCSTSKRLKTTTLSTTNFTQKAALGVSQPISPLPICEAYFEAAGKLGIPRNFDVNGERQDGVAFYQLTQRNARRSSASMAYIDPHLGKRPNLTVRTNAQSAA